MNYEEKLQKCLEKAKENEELNCHVLTIEKMIKTNNQTALNECWVDYFLTKRYKMNANQRYTIACVSIKTVWNNEREFYIENGLSVDKEILNRINNMARTFLHFEKLAKITYKYERPEIFTLNQFNKMIQNDKVEE